MENNITIKKDSEISLYQSQNLIEITNKILTNRLKENWIEKLWEWANKNNIPNTTDSDIDTIDDEKLFYWKGIPRDKNILLNVKSINLSKCNIEVLPIELFNLVNLKQLNLSDNKLTFLPNEIGKLKNLIFLFISNNKITQIDNKVISELNNLKIFIYDNNPIINNTENKFMKLDNQIDELVTNSVNNILDKLEKVGLSKDEVKEILFNRVDNE